MSENGATILIVDDDRDFSESTAAFLTAHGYRVVQAYNGREGIRRARLEEPDLILMDVMMDERTEGFFTVRRIRRDEALADVPVVVVSSIYREEALEVAPDPGWLAHDAFLAKPLGLDELLATVRARLAASAGAGSGYASGSASASEGSS